MMSVSPLEFKQALGRFASGVTVVSVVRDDEVYGITVSAFISVSLDPPLVLVSIAKSSYFHSILSESRRYGISILSQEQMDISEHFAHRNTIQPKYSELGGVPLIEGALSHLVCAMVDQHSAGDHTLFVGYVEQAAISDGKPLLYAQGAYNRLTENV